LVPLGLLVAVGIAFIAVGGHHYLTLTTLAENRGWLCSLVKRWGFAADLVYIASYGILVALSVPGGAALTIAGGFLFGTWIGTLCAIIGATSGATAIFLAARAGLGGLAQRAGPLVAKLEVGFRADAFNYLLVLRLVPILPFWLVNLVPALVGVKLRTYVMATFSASSRVPSCLPASRTGGNRAGARSRDCLSPERAFARRRLAVLALIPVAYKHWRGNGLHEPAPCPDLCAGLAPGRAWVGAAGGSDGCERGAYRVALWAAIACNFGCVPSKSPLAAARIADLGRRGRPSASPMLHRASISLRSATASSG
jgi:uncharacterized membrane protein YdjX (TVP38/TMEM64 family)